MLKVQLLEQPSLHLLCVEASSKIELLKMETNKEIALKMIELDDHNAKFQLQFAQLFAKIMRQGNDNNPSTS
jgi:hypothetical protein